MKTNKIVYFNGKEVVTSQNGIIDDLDGSKLTGIKITQLEDIPEKVADSVLCVSVEGNFEFKSLSEKVQEYTYSREEIENLISGGISNILNGANNE